MKKWIQIKPDREGWTEEDILEFFKRWESEGIKVKLTGNSQNWGSIQEKEFEFEGDEETIEEMLEILEEEFY